MLSFLEINIAEAMRSTIHPDLWHACAGGMIKMPEINSKVYYFPQGHAEHSSEPPHPDAFSRMKSVMPCTVLGITYMADPDTDEIYVKMRLLPIRPGEELPTRISDSGVTEMPGTFYKVLTPSDANTGGGLSVPKHCAENIFPALNYSGDPPVQTLTPKDIHGRTWRFRHIYRGTPKRHLLTTGWSNFVNQKRLVSGDTVAFVKGHDGELLIGIIRAKQQEDDGIGYRITRESVTEAALLASRGQPFEIVYYPRAETPEFCVSSSLVEEATTIRWFPGMRFKMQGESYDSSRTTCYYGTVVAYQEIDPYRWPRSPWRALQVTWDETHKYRNLKRLSPWDVKQTQKPASCYSPRKKPMTLHHSDIPMFASFRSSSSSALSPASWVGLRTAASSFIEESGSIQRARQRKRQALQLRRSPDHPTRPVLIEKQDSISPLGLVTGQAEKLKRVPRFCLFGQPIYAKEDLSSSPAGNDENMETNGSSFSWDCLKMFNQSNVICLSSSSSKFELIMEAPL